ncbi:MAG: hypothetical protein HQ523_13680 [Lentisphaerae bacterium]|nr:hypothetical protein [Lentisphaerota bacterium]
MVRPLFASSSGSGLDGTITGTTAAAWKIGRMDLALEFDGTNDGIVVADAAALDLTNSLAISAWVYQAPEASTNTQIILAKNGAYTLSLEGRHPTLRIQGVSPASMTVSNLIAHKRWTHLAATYDGTHMALYADGLQIGTTNATGTLAVNSSVLGIAHDPTLTNGYFGGMIDEVRLYSVALSTSQVWEVYQYGADPDGDEIGNEDELQNGSDPNSFGLSAGIAGDLNGDGQLTSADVDLLTSLVNDLSANVTRYTYDPNGNVATVTDALEGTSTFTYDKNNRQTIVTDALGSGTTNAYNAAGYLAATWDALGEKTAIAYNAFGNPIRITNALDKVSTMAYNSVGQVTNSTDSRGISQSTQYDALKRVYQVTVAVGTAQAATSTTYYDANDNVISNLNDHGIETVYEYDANNRPTKATAAKGTSDEVVTEYVYDARGLQTSTKDGRGNTQSVTYDALGRQLSVTDREGNQTEFRYDNLGRQIKGIRPNGRVIEYRYDKLGRQIQLVDGAVDAQTEYDLLNRVVADVNFRGIRSEFLYDAMGNVTNQVAAKSYSETTSTAYEYDAMYRVKRIVNGNDEDISIVYDALGRPVTRTDELGRSVTNVYADGINLTSYTKADGTVISNSYDSLSRLSGVYADGVLQQQFQYDTLSRMTNAWEYNRSGAGDDREVLFQYDALNRVSREIQNGAQVDRQYDDNGNQTQVTYPSAYVVKRTFDKNDALETLKNSAGTTTYASYTYDINSRIDDISFGSSVTESYGYDSRERLASLDQLGSSVDIDYDLSHDANGNVTFSDNNDDEAYNYTYDALDRVKRKRDTSELVRELLSYDKMGNWSSYSNNVSGNETRTINAANEYTEINEDDLTYDENGSLTDWDGQEFVYDYLDRLIEVKSNAQTIVTYTYDALNRRTTKEVAATSESTEYLYDGDQVIEEKVEGSLARKFIYGNGIDSPVAMISTGTYYYLRDWRGNIRVITDDSGDVVETYKYSLFGQTTIYNGSAQLIAESAIGNPYGYTGRRLEPETGLYHYRNRAYSPELGRFLQRDPAGYIDGLNLYAYTANNPLSYGDPYGLYRWEHNLDPDIGSAILGHMAQTREYYYANAESERRRQQAYALDVENALANRESIGLAYGMTGDEVLSHLDVIVDIWASEGVTRSRNDILLEMAAGAAQRWDERLSAEVDNLQAQYREHMGGSADLSSFGWLPGAQEGLPITWDQAGALSLGGVTELPQLSLNDGDNRWWQLNFVEFQLSGGGVLDGFSGEMESRFGLTGSTPDDIGRMFGYLDQRYQRDEAARGHGWLQGVATVAAVVVNVAMGNYPGAAIAAYQGITGNDLSSLDFRIASSGDFALDFRGGGVYFGTDEVSLGYTSAGWAQEFHSGDVDIQYGGGGYSLGIDGYSIGSSVASGAPGITLSTPEFSISYSMNNNFSFSNEDFSIGFGGGNYSFSNDDFSIGVGGFGESGYSVNFGFDGFNAGYSTLPSTANNGGGNFNVSYEIVDGLGVGYGSNGSSLITRAGSVRFREIGDGIGAAWNAVRSAWPSGGGQADLVTVPPGAAPWSLEDVGIMPVGALSVNPETGEYTLRGGPAASMVGPLAGPTAQLDTRGNLVAGGFNDYFNKATGGLSVDGVIKLYKAQTGSDIARYQLEKLFTDHKYAQKTLIADENLHLVAGLRGILNRNAPRTMSRSSVAEGWTKLPWYKSVFHNPWYAPLRNAKYVGPGGHMEGVYDAQGKWVRDPKFIATFNFFDPNKVTEHFAADVKPYNKLGN